MSDDTNLSKLINCSDLIVTGRVGIITSTGGSINAEIEVDQILKGSLQSKKLIVAFSTMGVANTPELNSGELYFLWLQKLGAEISVYGLADDELSAVIPFDDKLFHRIKSLISSSL